MPKTIKQSKTSKRIVLRTMMRAEAEGRPRRLFTGAGLGRVGVFTRNPGSTLTPLVAKNLISSTKLTDSKDNTLKETFHSDGEKFALKLKGGR